MGNDKILYCKHSRPLEYFLNRSKNPFMLHRYSRHYIFKICCSESYLSNSLCNDPELLFPDFRLKVNQMLEAYSEKYPNDFPVLFETFRSDSRQLFYFKQGVTTVRSKGTHFFGLGVDIVNFKDNKIKWNLKYDDLIFFGSKVQLYNLSPYELSHFQFIPVKMQQDFRDFVNHLTLIIQDLLNVKMDGVIGKITQGAILLNIERLHQYFIDVETKIITKNDFN